MAQSRAVASTISQPRSASFRRNLFSSGSRLPDFICSYAARRKPPVPAAGSHTRMDAVGRITSTIARMSGRGVKYWPAPVLTSSAFLASSPS